MKKILIIGDSILKGVVFDETSNRYKSVAKNKLKKLETQLDLEIKNKARFGFTTQMALDKHICDGAEDYDLCILSLGGNDCDFKWQEIADNPDIMHFNNTLLENFKENLRNLLNSIKCKEKYIMNLPPIHSEKFFNWFIKKAGEEKVMNWLRDKNNIYQMQEVYNNTLMQIANELNVKVLDIRKHCLLNRDYYTLLGIDGIHLNDEGYDFLCESIIKELNL